MTPLIDQVRRLLARPAVGAPACLVCGRAIPDGEHRLRVRGETYVHRRCATYRMRQGHHGDDRLGYPPRWARRR